MPLPAFSCYFRTYLKAKKYNKDPKEEKKLCVQDDEARSNDRRQKGPLDQDEAKTSFSPASGVRFAPWDERAEDGRISHLSVSVCRSQFFFIFLLEHGLGSPASDWCHRPWSLARHSIPFTIITLSILRPSLPCLTLFAPRTPFHLVCLITCSVQIYLPSLTIISFLLLSFDLPRRCNRDVCACNSACLIN